ncbi:MAG TPA: malto-oligosyltrehalose synthase [Candidatus Baltobacterales bacterium]|nr:malto-oligosyltrehalose synthase [Candidatus Baltobacterales bacterium]
MTPRCTYRLQLSVDFPFEAAASCAGYLASLGVTHVYCSPFLQSASGSAHGYDVVDPTRINKELGGVAGFRSLVEELGRNGLEVLMDIVPNHMASAGRANPWWWDILRNGRSSRYASYFDIDWEPAMSHVKGKVLLGVLGERYGRELEAGHLVLERQGSEVVVRYQDVEFPISNESLEGVDLDAAGADPGTLDAILQRQHYRLAYWRTAQAELNYRRFFTVDTLIGLRVERAEVLRDSHRLVLELVAAGQVRGLRIDHVDGLRDPQAYLDTIRTAAPGAYLVVEKVLGYDEELPGSFPVDGTTGYDFISHADSLFVDSPNEQAMTALYHAFTGESQAWQDVVRTAKQEVMVTELAPDLERLTSLLVDICERHRMHRDRTRSELQEAIREVAAALSVYRTYVRPGAASDRDRARVAQAVDDAAHRRPDVDAELLTFVGTLLLMEHEGEVESEFAGRFQQFTPAVMAKGVEDTAYYRYNRLVSLNEVGGDPGAFGRTVDGFHEFCSRISRQWPATMLTLATHDTKRSADVRSRLSLLSEIPAEWDAAVRRWAVHNERYRTQGYPDRSLEYLMYQTLVGAWPIDVARMTQFLKKASREAKTHTSWMDPVAAYEDAVTQFATSVMADAEFLGDLQTFIGSHQLVSLGRVNSLSQATLLLTCPGVPDLYQGSELWDLSLVDPDNRRPVDYELRRRLLDETGNGSAAEVMARADEGAPKLWLISRLLEARRARPELFDGAPYEPIAASGSRARHVLAFARGKLVVAIPRLVVGLGGDWGDTAVELPPGAWRDVLTGNAVEGGASVALRALLADFPVAVLAQPQG